MAVKKFSVDINLNSNALLGLVLEGFTNVSLPATAVEGRLGYNSISKLPVYRDGFAWQELASVSYVNTTVEGLAWKEDVRVATTGDVDIATELVPGQMVDDITLVDGDRVLLFMQSDGTENGIYISGATPERSADMDDGADFSNATVSVNEGTQYAGTTWRCTNVNPDIGTDIVEFSAFGTSTPDATTTVKGKAAFATDAEHLEMLSSEKIVTPEGMGSVVVPVRDQLETLSDSIAPAPAILSTKFMTLVGGYTALAQGTGTSVDDLTSDTTPDGQVEDFGDGKEGTLSAEVDGTPDGSKELTEGDDSGTYSSLIIEANDDPYEGLPGEGLYREIDALVRSSAALSVGSHTYQLKHTISGDCALFTFTVDDPEAVTISGVSHTLPAVTRYVSGVPSLEAGDDVLVSFSVNDAVKTHYNSLRLAQVVDEVSSLFAAKDVALPGTPPATDAVVAYVDETLTLLADVVIEDFEFKVYGYNSEGTQGVAADVDTGARADTVSDETVRVVSGVGEFPASGYGGVFDSTQSLKTVYTEELQLVGGVFKMPVGDYSGWESGPDYSTGMGTGDRKALFEFAGLLSNVTEFTLTLPDTVGFDEIETEDVKIYAKVDGVTDWVDCNKAYVGAGSPSADGDAAMVYAESSASIKRVTFGSTPRSGDLLISVQLPSGSTKEFGEVSITNIS